MLNGCIVQTQGTQKTPVNKILTEWRQDNGI